MRLAHFRFARRLRLGVELRCALAAAATHAVAGVRLARFDGLRFGGAFRLRAIEDRSGKERERDKGDERLTGHGVPPMVRPVSTGTVSPWGTLRTEWGVNAPFEPESGPCSDLIGTNRRREPLSSDGGTERRPPWHALSKIRIGTSVPAVTRTKI